ncbi:MAG: serine/threonine-protein kinase [Kiritimatiellia bacterium]
MGDWQIEAFLGSGLSGEVYRIVHRNGTEAALKLLAEEKDGLRERFHIEERALRRLAPGFQGLPRFYASGSFNGRPYYIMEFLLPVELPLPRRRIASFMIGVAHAVGQLHANGYVHRDLKPANIMLRKDGSPVLIDLGLIKSLDDVSPVEPFRKVSMIDGRPVGVGTVGYAAPEQLLGGQCSISNDIYSLGKLARACFRGRPPHAWRVVIRRATHDEAAERHPSAEAFAAAVARRNLPCQLGVLAGLLGIGILAFLLSLPSAGPPPDPPSPPPAIPEATASLAKGDRETDADYFVRMLPLAQQGNVEAQCRIAEAHFYGRGVKKDLSRAFEWYMTAANLNCAGAQASLGHCYFNGYGCAKDYAQAVRWYILAAEGGNLSAMTDLGYCQLNGYGVARDAAKAIHWIGRAARSGHAAAQALLGECYLTGTGVPPDPVLAAHWLRRAADKGNSRAQTLLKTL